jgi:TP901 family phage tail tape measure protein
VANIGTATISVIGDATGLTRSLQRGLQNAFKGAVGVAAAAAVTGVFVKGIQAANAWEKNVLRIFQLLPTYSDAAFKEMQGQLVDLATGLGANLQSATTAVYEAVGKGFEVPEALLLAEEAIKGSIASGAQIETVMDGLTGTINSYGKSVLSAKDASDILFQTFNLGGASVEALASQLYDVSPTAASLGIDFREVGSALAVLTAAGVPARVATTQLRTAFNELAKSGSAADKNFRAISGIAFPDFVKKGGTVQQAVEVMAKRSEETGVEIQNLFTSVNVAGQGFTNLANRAEDYNRVVGLFSPEELAGKTQKAFDIAGKGAATILQQARNNLKTYSTQFFTSFEPLSRETAALFYSIVNTVGPALQTLGPKVNAAITPIVAGLKELGPDIGQGIADAAERIGAAIGAVAAAIQQVWPSVEPILIRLRDAWNEIYPAVQNFANAVIGAMPAVASAFQGVLFVVGPVIGALLALAQTVLPPVINALATAIRWLSQFNTFWGAVGAGLAAGVGIFLVVTRVVGLFWTILQRGLVIIGRITTAVRALWILMAANPIGATIAVIAALAAAFVFAWKRSETFRNIVKKSFNAIVAGVGTAVKFLINLGSSWVLSYLEFFKQILDGLKWVPKFLGGGAIDGAAAAMGNLIDTVRQGVNGINAEIDRIVTSVQVEVVMTLRYNTVGQDATELQRDKMWQRGAAAAASAASTVSTNKSFGGGGGASLGPSGSDFGGGEDAKKAAASAAKAAAKALVTSMRSIGKALDAIARDTGRKTVDQLNTLFRTATERMQDGIAKAGEAGNKAMKSLLQGQLKVLQDNQKKLVALAKKRDGLTKTLFGTKYTLDEAKDFLADLREESTKFIEGVRTSITALGAVTRDTGGIQSTFTGMRNNLRKTIAQTNLFIAAMKKLDAVDLNKTAQKQLLEAFQSDPTEGLRQAQLLARSGKGGVGEINKLQAQLDKAAGSLATSLNDEFHTAGIKAAEGLVKGLQTQHDKIAREMDKIADVLVNRIKTKLKIKSPSQVFADEIGMQIPAGVSAGVRSGMPAMLRSITDMSRQAVTFGPGAVQVNGVSDPVAARRAGILAGEGISDTISDMRSRSVLQGTGG